MLGAELASPVVVAAAIGFLGLILGRTVDSVVKRREQKQTESSKQKDLTIQDRSQYREEMNTLVDRLSAEIDRLSLRVSELQGEVDAMRQFINEQGLTPPRPTRKQKPQAPKL